MRDSRAAWASTHGNEGGFCAEGAGHVDAARVALSRAWGLNDRGGTEIRLRASRATFMVDKLQPGGRGGVRESEKPLNPSMAEQHARL